MLRSSRFARPLRLRPQLALLLTVLSGVGKLHGASSPHAALLLKPNGGWCWFQDERVIVVGDQLVFGSVAGCNRDGFAAGDVVVTSRNLHTGRSRSATLHATFQCDDHTVPALLALPDGRILATYQSHGRTKGFVGPDLMRWRRTLRPSDVSEWTPEQTLPVGADVSYSNLFRMPSEGGRILLFHRGVGYNLNYLVSTDDGATFTYGGRLLRWPRPVGDPRYTGLSGGGRPYLKYAQAGDGTLHVVSTEDHPRNYDNSVYHAMIRSGQIHHSDGRVIAPLSHSAESNVSPRDLTCVFRGDADHVAWICDVQVDPEGRPRIAFSVQRNGARWRNDPGPAGDDLDHRYYYARWDGSGWRVNEIAYAGTRLYAGEDDYTGLVAIDPQNLKIVYLSTNADPGSGVPLVSTADSRRHWEIFKGISPDDGASWKWTPITRDSNADNLRPIVPIWPGAEGRTILLWLRGTYRRYVDYDLDVVGVLPEENPKRPVR